MSQARAARQWRLTVLRCTPRTSAHLFQGQAGEEVELHHLGMGRRGFLQALQGRAQRQERFEREGLRLVRDRERLGPDPTTAALVGVASARAVHQDLVHGDGRRAKEVTRALPLVTGILAQALVRLVDELGGLQGRTWAELADARVGQLAELLVEGHDELIGRFHNDLFHGYTYNVF